MSGGFTELVVALARMKKSKTELEKLIESSQKYLGDKARIPKPQFDPAKGSSDITRAAKALEAGLEGIKKIVLARENDVSEALNDIGAYRSQLAKSNFGLDPKNKDDAKKIAEAHKLFNKYFAIRVECFTHVRASLKEKSAGMAKVRF